jgi:hypothetical protein
MDIMATNLRSLVFVIVASAACASGAAAQTAHATAQAEAAAARVTAHAEAIAARATAHAAVAAGSATAAIAESVFDLLDESVVDIAGIVEGALEAAALEIEQDAGELQERKREERERQRDERERQRDKQEHIEDVYEHGKDALDSGRWSQAVATFSKYCALNGSRTDGGLYWKAYAQFKLAQRAEALATLKEMQQRFPSSRWIKEARALEIEMSGAAADRAATGEDDELKLLALNSLMTSDSEMALPALEKVLASPRSLELQKQALFILSQSRSPRARDLVTATARGASNPDLQIEAIRFLGLFGDQLKLKVLNEIYAAAKDVDIRREILGTYMIAGQRDLVALAARSEQDAELRSHAVQLLGVMHATGELEKIYVVEKSPEVRLAVVDAYMVAGDTPRLLAIAKADSDPEIRAHAIQMLGVTGHGKNAAELMELYHASGQSMEAREAVIDALFMAGDANSLVEMARKETNPTLRKAAVERLSLMKSKVAKDFLMELINK